MQIRDIAIIGAGPGGVSAAVQCKRLGIEPLIIDKTGKAGGLTANARRIENYPGFSNGISGIDFVKNLQYHLSLFKIEVTKATVNKITIAPEGYLISGNEFDILAKKVILAIGTVPKQLKINQAVIPEGKIVYNISDILSSPPQKAIIIGGGEASFDYALNLSDHNCQVSFHIRGKTAKAKGTLVNETMKRSNIEIFFSSVLSKVDFLSDTVKTTFNTPLGDIYSEGASLLVSIGREKSPLDFPVEKKLNIFTNHKGVFIIGDARLGSLGQIGIAVGDGLYAAFNAVREIEQEYENNL